MASRSFSCACVNTHARVRCDEPRDPTRRTYTHPLTTPFLVGGTQRVPRNDYELCACTPHAMSELTADFATRLMQALDALTDRVATLERRDDKLTGRVATLEQTGEAMR